jgi:hypothetical protein
MSIEALVPWQALEEQIKDFFAASGYDAERSVIREGRSGGRHEVDVLATKSDGITEFAVMVECKAWNHPIEKDVVSKVSFVMRDLGLNKGIIVSLEGWRTGADLAAAELGIDLWDATDLERRLGRVAVATMRQPEGALRRILGPEPRLDAIMAERQLDRERSGVIRREKTVWSQLAWVPFYLFDIRLSHSQKRFLRSTQVKSRSVSNLYNAISGGFHLAQDATIEMADVQATSVIPPRIRLRSLQAAITKEAKRLNELVNPSALRRQEMRVQALGLTTPFDSVEVVTTREVAWPYYVALIRRGDTERILALDAVRAKISERASRALTENCSHVVEALSGS